MSRQKQVKQAVFRPNRVPDAATLPPPGARESNAGDDFLVLWGARRAIEMLNPVSTLKCVRMEGLTPVDVTSLDPSKSYFLAADFAEYFGGTTFDTSDRVVISQLKYSTRHPDQKWTWGELRKTREKGASVIRRLAESYQDLFARDASRKSRADLRAEIIAKVSIRLVSNQFADVKVTAALNTARQTLETHYAAVPATVNDLLSHLEKSHHVVIQKLCDGSGLGDEFTDFLRVLDLSGCGEASRLQQKAALLHSIGESVSLAPMDALRRLCDLLREEAQPERQNSPGLTQADVLAALNVLSYEKLFPSPPQFETLRRRVPTGEAEALAKAILSAKSRCLLAHGEAGAGKTTTVQDVEQHLPQGSVVLIYDCYGGGSYHDLHAQRHTLDRTLPQLSNELAARCGLPFLVEVANNAPDALRDFGRRLRAAAQIVADSGGVLLVVVDAADNAVAASRMRGGDCFVPHLWSLWSDLPANCFLVMSARTHRQNDLEAPPGTARHELTGFSTTSSTQYFRLVFPGAGDRICLEFHERTSHNPRVQSYLLDRAEQQGATFAACVHALRHARRTPEEIFDDLIKAAVRDVHEPERAEQHLATLTCLMRPIPVPVLSGACGISDEEVVNFCRALRPGVLLVEAGVTFRDEDFETHLRARVGDLNEAHARLGKHFLELAERDIYAAQAVAEHFFAASLHEDSIRLALEGPSADIVTDDLLRLRVVRRRLELAMRSATQLGRDADGVRLLLRAAEIARTDIAVVELIRSNPELAMLHGNPLSVMELYARASNAPWFGPAHMRVSALYARNPETHEQARKHLHQARAWLRRYINDGEETHGWRFTNMDMARRVEATFHLEGVNAVQRLMRHWRPSEFVLDVLDIFVRTIAPLLTPEEVSQHLRATQMPIRVQGVVLAALWQSGHLPPREHVEDALLRVERAIKLGKLPRKRDERERLRSRRHSIEDWPLALCEMCVAHGLDAERTLRLLDVLGPKPLDRVPHAILDFGEHLPPLRAACLKAALQDRDLQAEELLPEEYRRKPEKDKTSSYDRHASERRTFRNTIGVVLPVHKLRAQALISSTPIPVESAVGLIRAGLSALRSAAREEENSYSACQGIFAESVCTALMHCEGDARPLIEEVADAMLNLARDSAPGIWLSMATVIARGASYRETASWLAERAARHVSEHPMPGKERWQTLLRCAEVVASFEDELCHDFYERALEAAEGIDDDAAHLLAFGAGVASKLALYVGSREEFHERRDLATRLSALVEAHRPYVSEEKLLPCAETLDAVCRLDPAVGLALCCRWDESSIYELDDGIRPVVHALTEIGYWLPQEAIWLLHLLGNEINISKQAVEALERVHEAGPSQRPTLIWLLDSLCHWIERDTPLGRRRDAAERLVSWADAHGMKGRTSVETLRRMATFARALPAERERDEPSAYETERLEKAARWMENARRGDLAGLQANSDEVERLQEEDMAAYLIALGRHVPFKRRTEFLESIISLDIFWYRRHPVLETLRVLLGEWHHVGAVRGWALRGVPCWIEARLPKLWGFENHVEHIKALWSLPDLPASRATLMLPGVICRLEMMDAQMLCAVASALCDSLSAENLRFVLNESLQRVQLGLERDDKPLPFTQLDALPSEEMQPAEALAAFYWVLLGHPDKRVRWRVLHAARQALRAPHGNPELLAALVRLCSTTSAGPFESDPDFFWMSARSFAMLLFERLADERPGDLAPHAAAIAQHALNVEFPHAQVRELARRACLRLLQDVPNALPHEVVEQLDRANRPFACLHPVERTYYRRSRSETKERERYEFNVVDTVPYWFDPLSETFGHRGPDVVDIATRWICDHWGRSKAECRTANTRRRERYHYKYTDNRHGSIPTVENLRLYLDYHAMMCAAGELVDTCPIHVETYDDPENASDPWDGWLEAHLPVFRDCWMADLRGPAPLRPDCWGVLPTREKWGAKRLEEFDSALGLHEPGREGWLVVYGRTTYGDSGRNAHLNVQSALVAAETARALMRARQSTHHQNVGLPVADRSHGDNWMFDEGHFRLQPILQQERERDRSLDQKDGGARGVHPPFTLLSDEFVRALDLRQVKGRRDYVAPDGEVVARLEVWSDDIHDLEHIHHDYSHGERLWIKREVLLSYLQQHKMDLIVEVVLQRHEDRSYGETYKFDRGHHVIYLFRGDGSLETLAGNRATGPEDRA